MICFSLICYQFLTPLASSSFTSTCYSLSLLCLLVETSVPLVHPFSSYPSFTSPTSLPAWSFFTTSIPSMSCLFNCVTAPQLSLKHGATQPVVTSPSQAVEKGNCTDSLGDLGSLPRNHCSALHCLYWQYQNFPPLTPALSPFTTSFLILST